MKHLGIALAALLAGCAALESPDPASPHYAYTTGWTVVLTQPLTIEPGAATVRLQYGRVVPRNGVQRHDPHCVVELDTVSDGPQTLQPGRFEVLRVIRSTNDFFVDASHFFRHARHVDDNAPTFLFFITEFRLRDPAQPALRSMTCAWDQFAPGNFPMMRHLSLDEIRSALGNWMRFLPPQEVL
ncbi:MAG: hypothetical protein ACLGH6_10115 [Gammaproteobacteria bacterium]